MRPTGRAALATLVVAAGCLLAPVATPTAIAAPAAACSGSTGVTVVVDFGATGGGRHVRCVAGDPSSGLEALGTAGFSYSFVPNKGPFVCAIDRRPDPCNGAPADAYWSYWSASRGGSWSYSNVGAHQRDPAPGSVEGWSFGAGPAPGVAPPATTTTVPPPPPTTRASVPPPPPPPAPSSPPTAAPGTGAPPPAPAADAPPPSDDTTAGATDEPAESADVRTTTTDRTTTTERRPDVDAGDTGIAGDAGDTGESAALETKNTSSSSGIGTGALVALAVTIAIAGSAVWEVRRRRSPS